MPLSTTNKIDSGNGDKADHERLTRLKQAVEMSCPGVCPERALSWTRYFRSGKNRKKHRHIQAAEALNQVLMDKTITVYPDEIVVGNYSSRRVGGAIYPELHGLPVLMDIATLSSRKVNPMEIAPGDFFKLLSVIPFWLFRFVGMRVYNTPVKKIRFILDQLKAHYYLINESGGISHIAPDYETLITMGTRGIARKAETLQKTVSKGSDAWFFHQAVIIAGNSLAAFGKRYADHALSMASHESNTKRKKELLEISKVCRNVPENPASTFREAVQSLFFAQIALNLESLDNAISPGRMDQYLYPFYQRDIAGGTLTRARAKEILAAFAIKTSEIVPVFSAHLTNFHGGLFNGQVVTVGGVDPKGVDAVNELSMIFLEIMEQYPMRQPNWHARIHSGSGADYRQALSAMLAKAVNSPALYNDDAIIPTLLNHGYSLVHSRDYTGVGCVEPVSQGRSFASTDAALFNLPIILELALNQGRRFNTSLRSGVRTAHVAEMHSMAQVKRAFEIQLQDKLSRLINDLKAVETANRKYHPTPLTSMLIKGCLESGRCSTAGGALYNFSGIQCVGPADTGDALYAINQAVFVNHWVSLENLVAFLKSGMKDPGLLAKLRQLDKFGNDNPDADQWTRYVVEQFSRVLGQSMNTRGGRYVTGLYSVTAHEYFGRITGCLPSGRRQGDPFASGISPANGADKNGPTAMLNSVTRLDYFLIANGINLNLRFDAHTLRGKTGQKALTDLIKTYFRKGGPQAQINVLDPDELEKARANPSLYPNLIVRVSGYSARFNDLSSAMKDEIIHRTRNCV